MSFLGQGIPSQILSRNGQIALSDVNGTVNILGGYSGNSIAAGVFAAIISGGGTSGSENKILDTGAHYSKIGGGYDNQHATDAIAAIINGGAHHRNYSNHTTIDGGSFITINTSSNYASSGGGTGHALTGTYARVGGGNTNTANGYASYVGAGQSNQATNQYAVTSGGLSNQSTGLSATVPGGRENIASGSYSLATGYAALASFYGEHAHAAKYFSAAGDAMARQMVMRRTTTTNVASTMFTDGSSERLVLPDNTTWSFRCLIVARRTDSGTESGGYELTGTIRRASGAANTVMVAAATKVVLGEDTAAWDVAAAADTSNGALGITVTGASGSTINWVGYMTIVQVQ